MYTVYKIINSINSKWYIGVHKTDNPNDSYFGSGKAIKAAIKKYGKVSFRKEIIFITENKTEAYALERQLTENYNAKDSYNMRPGGVGGFTEESSMKGYLNGIGALSKTILSEIGKRSYDKGLSKSNHTENGRKGGLKNKGKPKSEETKQKLRDAWARKRVPTGAPLTPLDMFIGGSSNGRTTAFDSVSRGSTPLPPSTIFTFSLIGRTAGSEPASWGSNP